MRIVALTFAGMIAVLMMGAADAQTQPSIQPATQRAFLLAELAQQLGQAELMNEKLQKEIADLRAKCGDPCKGPDK